MKSKSLSAINSKELAKKLFPDDSFRRLELRIELSELKKERFSGRKFRGYASFADKFSSWIEKGIIKPDSINQVERWIYSMLLGNSHPRKILLLEKQDLEEHARKNKKYDELIEASSFSEIIRYNMYSRFHSKRRVKIPTSDSLEYRGNPSIKPLKSNAYYAYL